MIELKGEREKCTILAGDVNIPISKVDRKTRQKISKDIANINNITDQQDLINI